MFEKFYKDKNISLTRKQDLWLTQHGGRNESDILVNEKGKMYVLMGDGYGGNRRVYLPEDKELKMFIRNKYTIIEYAN